MKLVIRRSQSIVTRNDLANHQMNLTPFSALRVLSHHPLDHDLSAPPMADYIALGAAGGNYVGPGKQPGIKVARNGNWLPFKVTYYRITGGVQISSVPETSTIAWTDLISNVFANKTAAANELGRNHIVGQFYPNSPPSSNTGTFVGRIYTAPEQLVYSNQSSQVSVSSDASEMSQGIWPILGSSSGYPGSVGALQGVNAIEPSYTSQSGWNIAALRTWFAQNPGTLTDYKAGVCDYYVIEIDDTLVANISSLTNDVFIVIPQIQGYNWSTCLGNQNGLYYDSAFRQGAPPVPSSSVSAELVFPLSYVLVQIALQSIPQKVATFAGIGTLYCDTDPVFNVDLTTVVNVSTASIPEIMMVDPPSFTGASGPL